MNQDKTGLITGADGLNRCWWCGDDPLYQAYHDHEWGRPVRDDVRLFEKITLEGFQAGLSWITILRKREAFRAAFDGFDFYKIARYTPEDVTRLLGNAGIIRHRGKIESAIHNAARAIVLQEEYGSLADYFWGFVPSATAVPCDYDTVRARTQTLESLALSKDLKKRGWKFVGPTTCYAFMQAMGLVQDHVAGCHCKKEGL